MEIFDLTVARQQLCEAIDNATKLRGLSYNDACIEFIFQVYNMLESEEKDYSQIAACFVDYYSLLSFKRDYCEFMSNQEKHDYGRFRYMQTINDVICLWTADTDCFLNAVNACYQMQKPYSHREELQQKLNSYDNIFLNTILNSIPQKQATY